MCYMRIILYIIILIEGLDLTIQNNEVGWMCKNLLP